MTIQTLNRPISYYYLLSYDMVWNASVVNLVNRDTYTKNYAKQTQSISLCNYKQ